MKKFKLNFLLSLLLVLSVNTYASVPKKLNEIKNDWNKFPEKICGHLTLAAYSKGKQNAVIYTHKGKIIALDIYKYAFEAAGTEFSIKKESGWVTETDLTHGQLNQRLFSLKKKYKVKISDIIKCLS
jgi:hypothetical protein